MDLQVLGDRYEMLEPIGRGGMATIYKARDRRMGRLVAVKILREMYTNDPKFVLRFQREARAVSALAHPNIVQVFDYGQSNETYYIVMELIEGHDLRRYLKTNGILDIRRAVVIAHDVALALGAAHRRGIVHRDVKPQNILVNDEALVKLTDFGIATFYRDSQNERLTTTGMTLGTVQYYAPEQAQGEVVSPAADVYALGVVLYEMLVGHPPFDGDTPVAIAVRHIQEPPVRPSRYNPNIPPALERVILRCLEKDPRDRYRDGDALAYALETFDKPRSGASSGRISAPMDPEGVAMRTPSRPIRDDGRGRGSGQRQEPDALGVYGFDRGPTRANVAAGTRPGMGTNFSAPEDDEKPSPVAGVTTAIIIASVLLLLGVSCFLVLKAGVFGGPSGQGTQTAQQKVLVPNFVGSTIDAATSKAEAAGLKLKANYVQSDQAAKTIIDQNPADGTSVLYNSTVTVDVSSGPNSVQVPSVAGESKDKACADLKALNLQCNVAGTATNSLYPLSTVDHTDPPEGASVAPNTVINLFISVGAPTSTPAPATATPSVTNTPSATNTPTATPTLPPCPTSGPTPVGGCH